MARGTRSSAAKSSNAPTVGCASVVTIKKTEKARKGISTQREAMLRTLPRCEENCFDQRRLKIARITQGGQRPMKARSEITEKLSSHINMSKINRS